MPFYKFTITLQDKSVHSGIRELLDQHNLDQIWRTYEVICVKKYGQRLQSFKVVHLSKLDPEVREFLANRGKTKQSPMEGIWDIDSNERPAPFKSRKDLHAESLDRRGNPNKLP